jgi:hypothetical protein
MNAKPNPTILTPAEFGAPFEGGFYGGQIRSHGGAKVYAIAWASKAFEFKERWLTTYDDVPGARSCFHSRDNTMAMAAAGSKAAERVLSLTLNGHGDWAIPARDVLELAYRHLKPGTQETYTGYRDGDNPSSIPPGYPYVTDTPVQTTAEAFREGGAEAFEQDWYGSSTQYSSYGAWVQSFGYGGQYYSLKKSELLFRPVRLIQLNP